LKHEEAAATHAMVEALDDTRLIATGDETAEMAHEALIRE